MTRFLLPFVVALSLAACSGGDEGPDPGTTGGETATGSITPETPRDESGSTGTSGTSGEPQGGCELVDCATGLRCVMAEVQCIRAPCPPQPTCVDASATCATTLCAPNTRCIESAAGARCVANP